MLMTARVRTVAAKTDDVKFFMVQQRFWSIDIKSARVQCQDECGVLLVSQNYFCDMILMKKGQKGSHKNISYISTVLILG